MYSVSQAYREAMKLPVQRFDLVGTISYVTGRGETAVTHSVPFSGEDVLSLQVSNQCSDGTSLKIGQVYVGELRVVFSTAFTLAGGMPRGAWTGAVIAPVVKMHTGGLNAAAETWESVPLGIYTIPSDGVSWTAQGAEISAYDNLAKLDRIQATSRNQGLKPYDLAIRFTGRANILLGQTAAEIEALPNGRAKLYLSVPDAYKTGRDVLAWIGEVLGCFVTAGRDGKIYFRQYSRSVVDTLDPFHRWQGCRFGDYSTKYSMVYVTNTADKAVYWAALEDEEFLRYDLGENPLLQGYSEIQTQAMLFPILTALQAVNYVPFQATAIGNPAYDLGDVIRFTDGIADGSKLCCITSFTYTHQQGFQMAGAGENPDLAAARGAAVKTLESADSSTVDKQHSLYVRNPAAITIQDGGAVPVCVLAAEYATAAGSHVEARAEILLTVETSESGNASIGWTYSDAVVTVTYESDGQVFQDFHPVQSYQDGQKILSLLFDFTVGRGYAHEFRILLAVAGGSVAVSSGGGLLALSGIGVDETPEEYPAEPDENDVAYIEVRSRPDKTTYLPGDFLDYTGLEIVAIYYDRTEADITALCTMTPADGSEAGEPQPLLVNVTYEANGETHKAAFDLTIAAIVRIDVTKTPDKMAYNVNDSIDMTGLQVTAWLSDGTTIDVTEDCTTIPPEGTQVLTVGNIIVDVFYKDGQGAGQFELTAEENSRTILIEGGWWRFYSDFDLYIYCNGAMPDGSPWERYFVNNRAVKITIENSVTSIANNAFEDMENVTSVTIPNSVTTIGMSVFRGCTGLTSITIPNSVTFIGDMAFADCGLTSVTIPNSVVHVGNFIFSWCENLVSLTIENGIAEIVDWELASIYGLTSVTIPGSVVSIGEGAFYDCAYLTSVTIANGVTEIRDQAFSYCGNLTSVTIPASVSFIASDAFLECLSLTDVYYGGTQEQWDHLCGYDDPWGNAYVDIGSATVHYNSTGPT